MLDLLMKWPRRTGEVFGATYSTHLCVVRSVEERTHMNLSKINT
jgi:predicted Kef-type K+ transport protein